MKNILQRWPGIIWIKSKVDIQLHTPRWQFMDGDYFLMAPTVIRFHTKMGFDKSDYRISRWGFGFVILGVGIAITQKL
jgi:hypothetical protein